MMEKNDLTNDLRMSMFLNMFVLLKLLIIPCLNTGFKLSTTYVVWFALKRLFMHDQTICKIFSLEKQQRNKN